MKKKKRDGRTAFRSGLPFLLWTMLAALLLSVGVRMPAAGAEDASAPLVAGGGQVWYTVADGEALLRSMMAAGGEDLTGADPAALRDEAVRTLAEQAAMNMKYAELGLDQVTEEEQTLLGERTRQAYDDAMAGLAAQLREMYGGNEEDSMETARALMKQTGMTYENIRQQVLAQWRSMRLAEKTVGDVQVSAEEIDSVYREQMVEPDREKYQGNVAAFEEEVLFGSGTSAYIPDDYRLVQWILLPPESEEITAGLWIALEAEEDAYKAATAAFSATYGSFDSEEALNAARMAYAEALEKYEQKLEALNRTKEALLESMAGRVDEILREEENGTPWEELIRKYSADLSTLDNPYPVSLESVMTDEALIVAAATLDEPGKIAEPVVTDRGVLLVRLARMEKAGPAEMTEEVRRQLEEQLLEVKKAVRLKELAAEWMEAYEIQTWPERLSPP